MGPGGKGASRRPHPFPQAHQTVPLCPVPVAPLPCSVGCRPSLCLPLCSFPGAWHSQAAMVAAGDSDRPPRGSSLALMEPARRCQGGVPGEPACAAWAWA